MTQPTASSARKAVVIGGAGFLGRRMVACLLGDILDAPAGWPRFETVHVFDAALFAHRQAPSDPSRVTSTLGDIRSRDDLRRALAGAHTVFHLASVVDVGLKKNVVHGHLLAASRLHDPSTRGNVGGKAYFVGEGNAINYFEFIRPYAAARGVSLPKLRLPYKGVEWVARGMELVHRVLGVAVPFHRFHLYILCKDFFFSNGQAERDLGYAPWVSPQEALARTIEWIKVEPMELPVR